MSSDFTRTGRHLIEIDGWTKFFHKFSPLINFDDLQWTKWVNRRRELRQFSVFNRNSRAVTNLCAPPQFTEGITRETRLGQLPF